MFLNLIQMVYYKNHTLAYYFINLPYVLRCTHVDVYSSSSYTLITISYYIDYHGGHISILLLTKIGSKISMNILVILPKDTCGRISLGVELLGHSLVSYCF